jgi:large subunit ribosomal protein L23
MHNGQNSYDIIHRPIYHRKSMALTAGEKVYFRGSAGMFNHKIEIKKGRGGVFGVKVSKVSTMNVLGKFKRQGVHLGKRPDWKKAVVTLTEDSKTIEFFDGMK